MSDSYILDSNRIIHIRRWWLVGFISVVMIFFSSFGLLSSVAQLVMYNTEAFKTQMANYPGNGIITGAVIAHYLLYYIIGMLVLNLLKLFAAVKLGRRSNWARVFYVIYFLVSALFGLLVVLGLSVSSYAGLQGLKENSQTQHIMTNFFGILIGVFALGLVFDLVGIFALSSNRAREEFGS